MTITGKYKTDNNFITVFTDNEMYTLAQNSSDWGCLAVGKTSYSGQILDRDTFEKLKADCTEEGTFELD